MEKWMLFRAGLRRKKGSLIGIGLLVFLTVLSFSAVLSVWLNGNAYIQNELERAGYGQITAWVSDVPELGNLIREITSLPEIEDVQEQEIIFSDYEGNEVESDSEGQMILWMSDEQRYRFLNDDLTGRQEAPEEIRQGEVYVSPSMVSIMDLRPGDTITFRIARSGMDVDLTVAGYYEDPFMGSSMIGMKGFLISEEDFGYIRSIIQQEGADALAREGAMLHISSDRNTEMTSDQINRLLTSSTSLPEYTQEIHSAYTIQSFMSILQNAFCGILAAFAVILLLVALVVLGHCISGIVEQEQKDMGILKTLGVSGQTILLVQEAQIITPVFLGSIAGIVCAVPAVHSITGMTVTTVGLLFPAAIPVLPCIGGAAAVLIILGGYALLRMQKIMKISPLDAIRKNSEMIISRYSAKKRQLRHSGKPAIRKEFLSWQLAIRQLKSGKKKYFSACIVAVLLVFFASLTGRMNSWLGPDGKGMMDAFNPSDLDLGVQALGEHAEGEMERMVLSYSGITDSYELAMPSVSVNGTNYTANVITEPDRFHISRGETCTEADEVVLTEVLAADLGVGIGDTVTIRGDTGSGEFTVAGIYHCANDMGANLGLSREGYLSIGQDDPRIWCHHYFLEDPSQRENITNALEGTFGGDVHVHQNTWPGLFGILRAMHLMLAFMYGTIAVFVVIVTVMTGQKILNAEQRDLAIYRSFGCTVGTLRCSFAFRFGITALIGGVVGTLCAAVFTDPLVSAVMRLAGISNFASHPDVENMMIPGIVVIFLFFGAAWLLAGKIGKTGMNVLMEE